MAAVIPNWNGRRLIDTALESLERQDLADLTILVVDNGSQDESVEHLAERWPRVTVVALDRNEGFAAAVNRGIQASAGEYVAMVNNDMRLEPSWATHMVAALDAIPTAASAATKILRAREPNIVDGAGDIVAWDGYCARRGHNEPDRGQFDKSELVFSACAGAALYRRSALDHVGGFDESFFAYIEDADWGFRAQLAGYDCVYEPRAVAHHLGAASSGRLPGFELYHAHRNMVTLMIKNYPAWALIKYGPWAVIRRGGSLGKAIAGRQVGVLLRAWGAALRRLPETLRARRGIQRARVRGYSELSRLVPTSAALRPGRAP